MGDAINLADPDFEPTDEQLMELSKRAFAGVKERREVALARMRAEIAARSAEVLRQLEAQEAVRPKAT
ncbi:MAG: hypothetical protein FWD17_15625 [Polyangiaceae bacterium]|nr:hypothetical protein [Polyangiaceae bacterium]